MTGNSHTSLVLPSTILKYFVTIIPVNKRFHYVSIFTKERNFTVLSDEGVNGCYIGRREGTGHGTKRVRLQVFLSCPKKRSKSINVIKPPNGGFLHIQEIQNYSKVQSFKQSPLVSLPSMNTFNRKKVLINKNPIKNLVLRSSGIMSAESSRAAGQHFQSREQNWVFSSCL